MLAMPQKVLILHRCRKAFPGFCRGPASFRTLRRIPTPETRARFKKPAILLPASRPTVVHSSSESPADIRKAYELGTHSIMTKSVTYDACC